MQAVGRVIGVLRCVAAADTPLGVSEIARRVGLAKPVVHRIAMELTDAQFLRKTDSSEYNLGPAATEFAFDTLGTLDLHSSVNPILRDLVEATGETASFSLRVGNERVYASKVDPTRDDILALVHLGQRAPLYAGCTGKAILSTMETDELERYLTDVTLKPITPKTITSKAELRSEVACVKKMGCAVSHGERIATLCGIASPVWSAKGIGIGAVSIHGPSFRFTPDSTANAKLTNNAAVRITKELSSNYGPSRTSTRKNSNDAIREAQLLASATENQQVMDTTS